MPSVLSRSRVLLPSNSRNVVDIILTHHIGLFGSHRKNVFADRLRHSCAQSKSARDGVAAPACAVQQRVLSFCRIEPRISTSRAAELLLEISVPVTVREM